jgi:hypothetical protein
MSHLLLDIVKIDAIEIGQHLSDLRWIVQNGTGRLGQMIQGSVASQGLRKGVDSRHLSNTHKIKMGETRKNVTHFQDLICFVFFFLFISETLTMMISSGQPFMAVKSQFSNDLAKLRMELVNDPGISLRTSGMSTSTRF